MQTLEDKGLLSNEPKLTAAQCPVCLAATRRRYVLHTFPILGCVECGHRFADFRPAPDHVQSVYSDGYFFGGQSGYDDYLAESRNVARKAEQYRRLISRFASPGRLLDVGCAAGFNVEPFVRKGWEAVGVEPNPTMAAIARKRLGIAVETAPVENLQKSHGFDLVMMVQVIAHVTSLEQTMEKISTLLVRGGLLLVETWDCESWTARLFGNHWHEYNPPSVLHYFSSRSLRGLMGRYGFDLVATGKPRRRITAGNVKAILSKRSADSSLSRVFHRTSRWINDDLSLPYPGDDLRWYLFGLNSPCSADIAA
jgi:SAM-dependent methyltransferase